MSDNRGSREFDYESQEEINEEHDPAFQQPLAEVYPTFFIGLGGGGNKIVRNLYKMVRDRPDFDNKYSKLTQFICLDTDAGDLDGVDVPHSFLISDFPKRDYVDIKLGRDYKSKDDFFTEWWPEWHTPRPDGAKGAGQVRIESRLSLYYQLEQDRQSIIRRVEDAIVQTKDFSNAYRKTAPRVAYCHIFSSLVGGTGSGGLLPMAYLMRELLLKHHMQPVSIAHLLMPTFYERIVRPGLHDDIRSNAYASLKELEWFMTLGFPNNPRVELGLSRSDTEDSIEFHYNPNTRTEEGKQLVSVPPFSFVNVIDEPGQFSFQKADDHEKAVASCVYVQLFSPIMAKRESEEDNYYKKVKHLEGSFSLNYGTYGLAMMVLPDRDILAYCENRMVDGLLKSVQARSFDAEGSGDSKSWVRQVAAEAKDQIEERDKPEKWSEIRGLPLVQQLADAGLMEDLFKREEVTWEAIRNAWPEVESGAKRGVKHLLEESFADYRRWVESFIAGCEVELTDDEILPTKSDGKSETLDAELDRLYEAFSRQVGYYIDDARQRQKGRSKDLIDELEKIVSDLERNGTCRDVGVGSPISVRLALLQIAENFGRSHDAPYSSYDGEDLKSPGELLDNRNEIEAAWHKRFLIDLVKDDWPDYRDKEICQFWEEDMTTSLAGLEANMQTAMRREVLGWLQPRLRAYELLDGKLGDIASKAARAANSALKKPGAMASELSVNYEVLYGERNKRRHWDRLFDWLVKEKAPSFEKKADYTDMGFGFITRSDGDEELVAKADTALLLYSQLLDVMVRLSGNIGGKSPASLRQKGVSDAKLEKALRKEARSFCRKRLIGLILGERQAGDSRDHKGLMLDECLELEARWELEQEYLNDHLANYRKEVHGEKILSPEEENRLRRRLILDFEPTDKSIQKYIDEKLNFVAERAMELANLRLTDTTAADPLYFVALHKYHYMDEKRGEGIPSLWQRVRDANPRFGTANTVPWVEEKKVAFYTGILGLPVHSFAAVRGALKHSYSMAYRNYVTGRDRHAKPLCDFPSHIDRKFEDPNQWNPNAVLPSLDPDRVIIHRDLEDVLDFMEMVVHGIVSEVDKTDLAGKLGTGWSSEKPGVGGPYRLGESLVHAAQTGRVTLDDKTADVLSGLPEKVWVLKGLQPNPPSGVDPVLHEKRREFTEVLGDRLDRAFETYRERLTRAEDEEARDRIEHVQALLVQASEQELQNEDPTEFWDELKKWVNETTQERNEVRSRQESGLRVQKQRDFLEKALVCLRQLYKRYKYEPVEGVEAN